MVRKIYQKTVVRELSISFLQARGGRNKVLEWIVKFITTQAKELIFMFFLLSSEYRYKAKI